MNIYNNFARVYDTFMDVVPYKKWAEYIDEAFKNHGIPEGALVLDLGCGTGTMAFLMAGKGYDIIGIDASSDMLSAAYHKKGKKDKVLFLNQNMMSLDLYGTVDAVYSTCDALNYMLTEEDLLSVFKNVAMFLNPEGIFIFDLKTEYKYRQMGENSYWDTKGKKSYVWKNSYNSITKINQYTVQFFDEEGENFTETHMQRAYNIETVTSIAKNAGFNVVAAEDNYTKEPADRESVRVTYGCCLL